jgi:putative oxidoreductase
MIGFVVVQSLTDLFGHGGIEHKETLGVWFDNLPDGVILDQRAFWVFLLAYLVFKGGGPLSLDRILLKSGSSLHPDDLRR